jgi:prepilin-type processing-associated H-X9-DG protein
MNGARRADGTSFDGGPVLRNMYRIKQPALRFVFIDDFGEDWDAAWAVCWSRPAWWNPVPARHGAGTTMSFADGHAEWWAWKDQRTIELMEKWDWDSRGTPISRSRAIPICCGSRKRPGAASATPGSRDGRPSP